jgi:hypothetical protein
MTSPIFKCLIILTFAWTSVHSQAIDKHDLVKIEDSLVTLLEHVHKAGNDSVRLSRNARFLNSFSDALRMKGSFEHPFDSLKMVSILTSPDKKFRMINWNVPKDDGTNRYFGFIQVNGKGKTQDMIIVLADRSDSIPEPETAILDNGVWYGALYYKIILTHTKGDDCYTLLGWNGLNSEVHQKVIEILRLDGKGLPHFGERTFPNYGNGRNCRVFFKFASSATMLLQVDNQYVIKERKWEPSKKEFITEREKVNMIVCDELVPLAQQFEGMYEYYYPSAEVFNGFAFEDGKWNFYQNVEGRNKRN